MKIRAVLVLALCSAFSFTSLQAYSNVPPKPAAKCSKVGVTQTFNKKKYTCIKSKEKLIFNKGVPISQSSAPISPAKFSQLASAAMQDSTMQVPTVETNRPVKIVTGSASDYKNFLQAASADVFYFNGPTPLIETNGNHAGARSLVTLDNRSVYKSKAALPPWGVTFSFDIKDPQGRFVVVTSAVGNVGPGFANDASTWRLAFKRNGEAWKYQNIEGINHNSPGKKFYDLVSLGSAGSYSIQLQFTSNITFYGLGLHDSLDSISKIKNDGRLRVLLFGDSWTFPILNDDKLHSQFDGYPTILSWLTGWNIIAAGVPGQGYLAPSAGETYKDRIVRDVIPTNPAVVILTGSPNDHNPAYKFTAEQIAEEVANVIKSLKSANPNILIILATTFDGNPNDAAQYKIQAKKLNVPILDFTNNKDFDWSNKVNLVQGHPSVIGSQVLARDLLELIARIQ
ncbi:MAG: hypothetical protein F2827_02880 [Actinobacteria bacterium]|nr:hypothetical protein [Actinomycetota bacterium]